MIRSVPYRVLRASLSPEAFQALMSAKQSKDLELQQAIAPIVAAWKAGQITPAEKDAQEAPIYAAYTDWALSTGIYEETTIEQDEAREEGNLADVIESMTPARILKIVTRVTNYFRARQDPPKDPLTESQVRTRLLS
jgi:hypothetical protein